MPFSCGVSKNVRRSDPSGVIVSKWKTIIELPALCAVAERCPTRAYVGKLTEMDAGYATAWSCGGATDIANCQLLCQAHHRSKGNR